MLFNSITFLVFFLPLSLVLFYLAALVHEKLAKTWLIFVSLLFYGWWNPSLLWILVGSFLINYVFAYSIQRHQQRAGLTSFLLLVAILGNIGLLIYYKYLLTFMKWLSVMGISNVPEWGSAVLPLGISFFTFTQIGFLIDVQAGTIQEKGFLEYVLFVTFFPHLIAGPILHHEEIMPQFAKKETYSIVGRNLVVGATVFLLGLGKKVLIADQIAPVANDVFRNVGDKHVVEAWGGVLAYSLQLYFDFSGYSEMALGLARMFNVTFPANFDSPFKSRSIIDFWQRWHISLTRYFTHYLYTPLSLWLMRRRADRGVMIRGKMSLKDFLVVLALPTLFTMSLMGIWHGAGLQFLLFGLLNAFYLCVNHAWRFFVPKGKLERPLWMVWSASIWKWSLTYLAIAIALIFFRAKSTGDAFTLIHSMFGGGTGDSLGGTKGFVESIASYFGFDLPGWGDCHCLFSLLALFLIIWTLPNVLQLFSNEMITSTKVRSERALFHFNWNPSFGWGIFVGLLALATLLMVTGTTEFLYFRL